MSEYPNFNPYSQMDLDAYHGVEEGVVASNHPTPGATGSNPHTPQHTEPFEGATPGAFTSLGIDIPHWETLQQQMQNQYQHHQEYHSQHTSPMHSTTPTPNAFHTIPIPHDAALESPAHTVPSQRHHDHPTANQNAYVHAQYQQGQPSPNIDNTPILLHHPDVIPSQAPRHRVSSTEMSRPPSTTPTSSSLLMQSDRSSPAPVASGSRSKSKESSSQGGPVRNTRSTRARAQHVGAAPYQPRPAPGAPAGRLGGMMGATQPAASNAPSVRQTRQSAIRFSGHAASTMERKVSVGSTGMPSPSEFRVPGSAAGSPYAPSPSQLSPPVPTPSSLPVPPAPAPAQDMGGGMFIFHSKNKVTASSSTPSPFAVPSQPCATSSKSKSAARPSAPRPPPVVTEFIDAGDRLSSIPEGKENECQLSTSTSSIPEPQARNRRSAGPSSEASASKSQRYQPYAKALRILKLKAFQSANVPSYAPRTDIHYDAEQNTMIASMELPGVKKDDIRITLGTSKFNHIKFVHIIAQSLSIFDRVGNPSAEDEAEPEEFPAETANEDPRASASEAQSTSALPSTAPKLATSMELVHAGLISPDVRERRFGILKRAFPVPSFTKIDDLEASLQDGVLTLRMYCGKPNELDDVQEVIIR